MSSCDAGWPPQELPPVRPPSLSVPRVLPYSMLRKREPQRYIALRNRGPCLALVAVLLGAAGCASGPQRGTRRLAATAWPAMAVIASSLRQPDTRRAASPPGTAAAMQVGRPRAALPSILLQCGSRTRLCHSARGSGSATCATGREAVAMVDDRGPFVGRPRDRCHTRCRAAAELLWQWHRARESGRGAGCGAQCRATGGRARR